MFLSHFPLEKSLAGPIFLAEGCGVAAFAAHLHAAQLQTTRSRSGSRCEAMRCRGERLSGDFGHATEWIGGENASDRLKVSRCLEAELAAVILIIMSLGLELLALRRRSRRHPEEGGVSWR